MKARRAPGGVQAQVSVKNIGTRAATEVAQLYIAPPGKAVERPLKLLRGFERVSLEPSEIRTVEFFVPDLDLAYWSPNSRSWLIEPGEHRVMIGGSSSDDRLLSTSLTI